MMSYNLYWGLPMVMIVIFVLLLLSTVLLGIWTYKDARTRSLDAGMWTVVVVLIPNLIGLLLYFLIGRRHTQVTCPHCGAKTDASQPYCGHCGQLLGDAAKTSFTPTSKAPLIGAIVAIVLVFLGMLGMFGSLAFSHAIGSASLVPTQTVKNEGSWKFDADPFNGERTQTITVKKGADKVFTVDRQLTSGKVQVGVSVDKDTPGRLIDVQNGEPYDFSQWTQGDSIILHLYGTDAKGKISVTWQGQ